MATNQPYISFILPAFNECATIAGTLNAMRNYLCKQAWEWEVIVAADGTDGTRERAAEFVSGDGRFIIMGSPQRRGKGRGVREGVLRARGQIIGFLDADYKTPVDEVSRMLPWLEAGFEVVIGSRRIGDPRIGMRQPLYRQAGSRIFNFLVRKFMGLPNVRDTQCGFKFFTRSAAQLLFSLQRVDGYMFDVEILRLSQRLGLGVKEIGVAWRDDGDSRYDPIAGTIKNILDLLKMRRMRYVAFPRCPRPGRPSQAALTHLHAA